MVERAFLLLTDQGRCNGQTKRFITQSVVLCSLIAMASAVVKIFGETAFGQRA